MAASPPRSGDGAPAALSTSSPPVTAPTATAALAAVTRRPPICFSRAGCNRVPPALQRRGHAAEADPPQRRRHQQTRHPSAQAQHEQHPRARGSREEEHTEPRRAVGRRPREHGARQIPGSEHEQQGCDTAGVDVGSALGQRPDVGEGGEVAGVHQDGRHHTELHDPRAQGGAEAAQAGRRARRDRGQGHDQECQARAATHAPSRKTGRQPQPSPTQAPRGTATPVATGDAGVDHRERAAEAVGAHQLGGDRDRHGPEPSQRDAEHEPASQQHEDARSERHQEVGDDGEEGEPDHHPPPVGPGQDDRDQQGGRSRGDGGRGEGLPGNSHADVEVRGHQGQQACRQELRHRDREDPDPSATTPAHEPGGRVTLGAARGRRTCPAGSSC